MLKPMQTLNFAIKVNAEVNEKMSLSMACEQACLGSVALTATLNSLAKEHWHNIAIDLQCFQQAGIDFSQVTSPFQLRASGKANVSFADISIVPNAIKTCHY